MFWDNPGDSRDMQRLKNGLFLRMPVSNDTRDGTMPVIGYVTILAIVGGLIYAVATA